MIDVCQRDTGASRKTSMVKSVTIEEVNNVVLDYSPN